MKEPKTTDIERSGVGPSPARRGSVGIVVVHSPDALVRERSIVIDRPTLVGRPGIDEVALPLDDQGVSRRHATLRPRSDGNGLEIEDHDSRNGTIVDGQAYRSRRLPIGSLVRVGDTVMSVEPVSAPALPGTDPPFVACSTAFRQALADVDAAATSDLSLLLVGETGTGKEVLAQRAHAASGRTGRMVAVCCAAIPHELVEASLFGHKRGAFTGATADAVGYFAQAEGGTLFLDEIGELALDLQAKLLRVLESREFAPVGSSALQKCDVRVVAATNADLKRRIERGTFRADLYARLAGLVVPLPALRERRSDVLPLARRFLRETAPDWNVDWTASFAERLCLYHWPMNVRELRTLVRRLALQSPRAATLHASDLGRWLDEPATPERDVDEEDVELGAGQPSRDELVALLGKHHGRVADLAAHYGKHRRQVYRWLARYEIDPADFKG